MRTFSRLSPHARPAPRMRRLCLSTVLFQPPRLLDTLAFPFRLRFADDATARDHRPRAVDFENKTACAAVRAHGAAGPLGRTTGAYERIGGFTCRRVGA